LLDLVERSNIDAGRVQQLLDQEDSSLAYLPRMIMTAWYTGIVGDERSAADDVLGRLAKMKPDPRDKK
jgi:hypothetical protein